MGNGTKNLPFRPDYAIPPGETLRDLLAVRACRRLI